MILQNSVSLLFGPGFLAVVLLAFGTSYCLLAWLAAHMANICSKNVIIGME